MKRLIKLYLISTFLEVASLSRSASAIDLPKQINIYCTSNMDGTANCYEVKTNKLLKCIAIPGDVIPCKTQEGNKYACIPFADSLFNCSLANDQLKNETAQPDTDIKPTFKDRLRDNMESWENPIPIESGPKQETTKDNGGTSPLLKSKPREPNPTILMPAW